MFLGFPTYVLMPNMPKIADYRFLLALLIANHDKHDSGSNKHFTTEKIIPTSGRVNANICVFHAKILVPTQNFMTHALSARKLF